VQLKGCSIGLPEYAEVPMIDRKHAINPLSFGQMHRARIGKVQILILIPPQNPLDAAHIRGAERKQNNSLLRDAAQK